MSNAASKPKVRQVMMREVPHKEVDWSTAEVYKLVPLQERDIKIMNQLAQEPGLYEPCEFYDGPVPDPDALVVPGWIWALDKDGRRFRIPSGHGMTTNPKHKRLSPPGK